MRHAETLLRNQGCDFGLLFCEQHNVAFYGKLGWSMFSGDVICEQHGRNVRFDLMNAMFLALGDAPAQSTLDLCGPPW